MTKLQQTLYQMLKEIHEICVQNEITYILHPQLVLFLQNELDIPENYDCRCVYMTAEDFHRFVSVCSKNLPENRSIESLNSNPKYPDLYTARYGNTETLCLNVNEGFNYVNNGLFIRIEILRSYPKSSVKKKILTVLEVGWRANTYQYTNQFSKKELVSKVAVRCMMLFGRKTLGRFLYKFFLKAYQCDNPKFRVRAKGKTLALPKNAFEAELMTVADNEGFYIPVGWKRYLKSAFGNKYGQLLKKKYVPAMSIIENPYMSSEEFFKAYPQLGEFFRERMSLRRGTRKMKKLLEYRTYCWAMVNMAGDKYRLMSYYDKNRTKIKNLRKAKNQRKLMAIFTPYYKTQKKYKKYGQTFDIDPEIDKIYYETLRRNKKKGFAEQMQKLL